MKMSSIYIRSSQRLLRMLVNSKICVYLSPVRQISRLPVGEQRLRHLTKFVGVSSCVAVGAGLAGFMTSLVLYNPDLIKLHAKAVDSGSRAPDQWNFIAEVVEKVSPAVVYIEIEGRYVFIATHISLRFENDLFSFVTIVPYLPLIMEVKLQFRRLKS